MKKIASFIVMLFLLFLGFVAWFGNNAKKQIQMLQSYELEVEKGETLLSVLEDLKSDGVIKGILWFRVYGKIFSDKVQIQAGHFLLKDNISYKELLEILQSGKDKAFEAVFLEGWRADEVVDALVEIGLNREALENCLKNCEFDYPFITEEVKKHRYEGYLHPDTYFISKSETPFSIFNRMLGNFSEKISEFSIRSYDSFYETMTVASMLEREARTLEDKKIVAGIIQNRLEAKMLLGVDATVLYALGDWEAELNTETLDINSLYNTRKYANLPPSPISNPGIESIRAAMFTTPTEFYYYLNATEDGKTYFAETLEEHNRNKALYIK